MSFRILCADECETAQKGIQWISHQHNCPIEKFVSSVTELETAIREEHFDVLITEMRLGSTNMLEFVGDIKKYLPELKAILYTASSNATHVAQALAYHFHDVVFKTGRAEKFARSLQSIETGHPPTGSPLLTVKSFLEMKTPEAFATLPMQLTKRERQILIHLSLGLSNREMSSSINISVETVKEHVQNLLRKLSLKDRTAAAVWALRSGIPELELRV